MALEVVLGAPFSGKSQFARSQIEARERAGELGVIAIDYSAIYRAIVPGVLSQYRDAAIAETGAATLAGYLFEVATRQAAESNQNGYLLVNSPLRAERLVERIGAPIPLEMEISIETLADRTDDHLTTLRRDVPRARNAKATAKCTQAGIAYLRERYPRKTQGGGAGNLKTRRVRKATNGQWKVDDVVTAPSEAAFIRGLTPAGKRAREALIEAGDENPTPAAVFKRVLEDRLS